MASHHSGSSSRHSQSHSQSRPNSIRQASYPVHSPLASPNQLDPETDPVPVEVLVEYLLAAKRSLSSIQYVLRANDLAAHSRQLHEQSVVWSAQTAFLRGGIGEQLRLLRRVRKGMGDVYDAGKADFKQLIRQLDSADGQLNKTMVMLSQTAVDSVFRPKGEEPKTLMDFVDEKNVDGMREALKASLAELRVGQPRLIGGKELTECRMRRHPTMATCCASTPICARFRRPCPPYPLLRLPRARPRNNRLGTC